jgi:hypothetical protein
MLPAKIKEKHVDENDDRSGSGVLVPFSGFDFSWEFNNFMGSGVEISRPISFGRPKRPADKRLIPTHLL